MVVTEMPSVQLTSLMASTENDAKQSVISQKENIVDAILQELGENFRSRIPLRAEIMCSTKEAPCSWDPIQCFYKSPSQSDESFEEQKLAITVTVNSIQKYCDLGDISYTKNVAIRGFPGGGKTFCTLYCMLYAISRGLNVITTARMAARANQLGGTHWHKFFDLPIGNLSPQQLADRAVSSILQNPVKLNLIRTLDVICADELGQLSAEFVSAIGLILRKVRGVCSMFGGVLLIGTLDHTQIQPWECVPFLTSTQIIPNFVMVGLRHSVRTNNEQAQRMQTIARENYHVLSQNPDMIDEFIRLASDNFTFVDSWESPFITPCTFRVYSKRVPVVEAGKIYIQRVLSLISPENLRRQDAVDVSKMINARIDWTDANNDTSEKIEVKVKEPRTLLFYPDAVYECTYNKSGVFHLTDPVLLYDLPSEDQLREWKPVKVLKFPVGCKIFEVDITTPKDELINNGFIEIKVDTCRDSVIYLGSNTQARRKQYALRPRISSTIHACMGDTHPSVATCITLNDPEYAIWDKGMDYGLFLLYSFN